MVVDAVEEAEAVEAVVEGAVVMAEVAADTNLFLARNHILNPFALDLIQGLFFRDG
jgi:hypothetical protein